MDNWFTVEGWWAHRQQDAEELARRLAAFFNSLTAIDPIFGNWTRGGMRHRSIVPRDFSAPPNIAELRHWLEENPCFEARDGRKAFKGYRIDANAMSPSDGPTVMFSPQAPLFACPRLHGSSTALTILAPRSGRSSLRSVARAMLLALARAFDANSAGVATGDFCGPIQPAPRLPPRYTGGWMIYLRTEDARSINLPSDMRTAILPGGHLQLIATEEIFERHDTAHHAAAARTQAVLAPSMTTEVRKGTLCGFQEPVLDRL